MAWQTGWLKLRASTVIIQLDHLVTCPLLSSVLASTQSSPDAVIDNKLRTNVTYF